MTLNKAIELLEILLEDYGDEFSQDDQDSIRLGIEALQREQHRREYDIHLPIELLPGETKE